VKWPEESGGSVTANAGVLGSAARPACVPEPLVSGAESTTSLAMLSSGLERSDKKEDKTKRRPKAAFVVKKLLD